MLAGLARHTPLMVHESWGQRGVFWGVFGVQVSGFRVQGAGCRAEALGAADGARILGAGGEEGSQGLGAAA